MNPDIWAETVRNLANVVAPEVGEAGVALWRGLALIMLVWTGTQMALAGSGFNMGAFVRLVMVLAIPRGILEFYVQPLPGTGMNVPEIITGMGGWLQGMIIQDAGQEMLQTVTLMGEQLWRNVSLAIAGGEDAGWLDRLSGLWSSLGMLLMGGQMALLFFLVLFFVFAVGQAQVIWANFALAMAILLGPIFVPFMVVPQLSFLFWGWLKTMLVYSLYAAVAAAVFRVTTEVGQTVLVAATLPASFTSIEGYAEMHVNAGICLLYAVAGLLASLKVGEFCQLLLSGSGSVSSGAGSRAIQGARVASMGM